MDTLTQPELAQLLRVSWIVLIPVGVLLSLVLYQLVLLLYNLLDFLGVARYELAPALKDLRMTAEHVESLSRAAADGVKTVENGIAATGPAIQNARRSVVGAVDSFLHGLKQSFHRD